MDLEGLIRGLRDCPCGKKHYFDTKLVEIGSGITSNTGEILSSTGFPKRILVMADKKTLKAADGVLDSLKDAGFDYKLKLCEDCNCADMESVTELREECRGFMGLLAVGTGSLGDLCRLASYRENIEFAIFATAPSMDGFASDTAPIIENNFKLTMKARQPKVIIADTKILAASPTELKAAGFGDMMGKFTAITDWRIANILTGEYYCENIAELTMDGVRKLAARADRVSENDEETAGQIMEGLIMSGLAMKLAESSRPASGGEHVLSHFWECKKLAAGQWPEYHGKKVGVAAVTVNALYRKLAEENETIQPTKDKTDWEAVKAAYGEKLAPEMMKLNFPTVTDEIDPALLKEKWPEIRKIIFDTLPTNEELLSLMKRAGAATTPAEVNVNNELFKLGLKYHSYMRHRVLLTRLIPMLGLEDV